MTENSGPGQAYKTYFPVALRSPIGEILVDSGSGHNILETKLCLFERDVHPSTITHRLLIPSVATNITSRHGSSGGECLL